MACTHFDIESIAEQPADSVQTELRRAMLELTPVEIDYRTYVLREPHSNADIATEYLEVLFFGETIVPYCKTIEWCERPGPYGPTHIRFIVVPSRPAPLARKLLWFSEYLRQRDDDAGDFTEYEEEREAFKFSLGSRVVKFNDLAENFVRNFIVGLQEEYHGEELAEIYAEARQTYSRWWDRSLESD